MFFNHKSKLKFFFFGVFFGAWLLIISSCGTAEKRVANSISEINPSVISSPKKSRAAQTLFEQNLPKEFILPDADDAVLTRILKDYGAIFVARGGVISPPKILFENEEDCAAWQEKVPKRRENFGVNIELQEPAMRELLAARSEARAKNFDFTARGTWAARRDYNDTVKIWATRVNLGLNFWTQRGKITTTEAARIRNLAPSLQVAEILRLEANGLFFSKDFSKSILYSATAPGASQHLSMLAIDLNENASRAVRETLARHGWFQTVVSDLPHFTFLGAPESDLPALGLRKIIKDNRVYWIPE